MFSNLSIAFVLLFSLHPLSCSPGSFIITPYIYQSFSAVPARLPFFLITACPAFPLEDTATSAMYLLGTWWDASGMDIRWADWMFTCCLAWLRVLCGGVWRQSGHVCEVSVWMETEAPCFPPTHTLHILTKESHSLGQMVPDTCENCPSCVPFIPPRLSSLFSLADSLFPLPLSLSVWRRIA